MQELIPTERATSQKTRRRITSHPHLVPTGPTSAQPEGGWFGKQEATRPTDEGSSNLSLERRMRV